MADLRELYQEVVLDHGRRPRNLRALDDPTHQSVGYNPLCGDKMTLFLDVEEGAVADVCFQGSGCAISTASASLLTELVRGRTTDEALDLARRFVAMVTGDATIAPESLGKLVVLAGVRDFPARVKCATLAWHTLQAALEERGEPVTTE